MPKRGIVSRDDARRHPPIGRTNAQYEPNWCAPTWHHGFRAAAPERSTSADTNRVTSCHLQWPHMARILLRWTHLFVFPLFSFEGASYENGDRHHQAVQA